MFLRPSFNLYFITYTLSSTFTTSTSLSTLTPLSTTGRHPCYPYPFTSTALTYTLHAFQFVHLSNSSPLLMCSSTLPRMFVSQELSDPERIYHFAFKYHKVAHLRLHVTPDLKGWLGLETFASSFGHLWTSLLVTSTYAQRISSSYLHPFTHPT